MDLRLALALVSLAGCAAVPPPQPWTDVGPSRVLEVLNRHQCAACHSVESVFGATSLDAPQPARGCTRSAEASETEPFCHLPTLASMDRFRARWLRTFLDAPISVRPGLAETMVRPELTPAEVDTLIAGWNAAPDAPAPEAPPAAALARGAALYREKQCAGCHQFGELPAALEGPATPRQRALAPDLRHARLRLARDTLERFIFSPTAVKPTAEMPPLALTLPEASALADFIYFAPFPTQ